MKFKTALLALTAALAFLTAPARAVAEDFDAGAELAEEPGADGGSPVTPSSDAKPSEELSAEALSEEPTNSNAPLDVAESELGAVALAEADPLSAGAELVKNVRSGNWRLAASGVLALLMLGLMRFRDKIGWFGTDRGGSALVMILSLGGGLSTSLATGQPINLQFFGAVIGSALTAAGGYHWLKSMIWPKDKAEAKAKAEIKIPAAIVLTIGR